MSDKGDKEKKQSIAGFLFMPQFGRCLTGFSHVMPVFMRTMAIMFAQAHLIDSKHPALRYGAPGVPRSGFGSIMQSAWTTLRSKKATPYQWGTYIAVVMLCIVLLGGFAHAVTIGALGVGTVAKAQIYSLTGQDTDSQTMLGMAGYAGTAPNAGQLPGNTPVLGTSPFDYRVTNCGGATPCTGHDDFAIMLLDKVIRQGTHNVGGYLQNGMQAMMAVYNTGILVVAGFLLLWCVLCVVVDTAKTGTVGGGKHNMVWAPIRIIFALGLLMPLSTEGNCTGGVPGAVCGFSSGQLAVQKIAEWGSNLGTNTWQAYLGAAAAQALVAPVVIDDATPMVQAYANMWLCRVFYNAYSWEATGGVSGNAGVGGPPPNIHTVVRIRKNGEGGKTPTWQYSFGTQAVTNLCGKVVLPYPAGDVAGLSNYPTLTGGRATPWQYAVQNFKDRIVGYATAGGEDPETGVATPGFYPAQRASWHALFDDHQNNSGGCCGNGCDCDDVPDVGGAKRLVLDYWARAWACDMAMHQITGTDYSGPIPVSGSLAAASSPLVLSGNCGADILVEGFRSSRPAAGCGVDADGEDINPCPDPVSVGIAGAPLGTCTVGGPSEDNININYDGGEKPDRNVYGVGIGSNISFYRNPDPDPETGEQHYSCIEKMTRIYSDMITTAISQRQNSLLTAFYAEMENDRGWADMGSWYVKLTQVNKTLDWAKKVQVSVVPGSLVYTRFARELSVAASGSTLDKEMLKTMHAANEWWKKASTVSGRNQRANTTPATVYINSCSSAAPDQGSPGLVACPLGPGGAPLNITNYTLATSTSSARVASPTTIKAGAAELGIQDTALGFLAPNTDYGTMMVKGVMDFTTDKHPLWILDLLQPGIDNIYPYTQLIQIGNGILKMGLSMSFAASLIAGAVAATAGTEPGVVLAMSLGPVAAILTAVSSAFILAGITLGYWVPLLPFVRVAFAVMAWIVSVFEAVVMVPIAALNHISTQGEGLAGQARNAWILWLNVLLRPSLTVIGYVGSIMVFNGFIVYFNRAMASTISSSFSKADGVINLIEWLVVTVVYVGSMYVVANASFKLVDSIPAAFFRWMGGSPDTNFEDHSIVGSLIQRAGAGVQGLTSGLEGAGRQAGTAIAYARPKEGANATGVKAGNVSPGDRGGPAMGRDK